MKIFTTLIAAAAIAIPAFAQTADEVPNRLLVTNTLGDYKGFVIESVDNISFAKVEGDVYADIDIIDVTADAIKLSVLRSEACRGFIINVVPATLASQLTDDLVAISYLNRLKSPKYYEDFNDGVLSGIELNSNSEYQVITVGIDEYGVETGVCRADIKTPPAEIVGDPKVEVELVDATLRSFTIKITPNADVKNYYCVAGEKGTMQEQYEMFGPMFGFSNFEQMIMSWGVACEGVQEKDWKDMAPNTEYEVFIVCTDINDEAAPYQVFETATLSLGGEGEALVSIEPGEYKLTQWGEEMLPSQFFTFTPNDQASCYRFSCYLEEEYDKDKELIIQSLCSDPPMPTVYWFFYEPMKTDFQVNPNTPVVVIAAAKNINGEWGTVNELRYTTPAEVEGSGKTFMPSMKVTPRLKAKKPINNINLGRVPIMQTQTLRIQVK